MSAVASAVNVPSTVPGHSVELAAAGLSTAEIQAAEQKRGCSGSASRCSSPPCSWPPLSAPVTRGGSALRSLRSVVDILVLVWLAMSSDTNGVIGEAPGH